MMLNDRERLDDLIIGGYKLIQHMDEFCFAIDAVLLGHFATIKKNDDVVDLGSGSGVLGFIMLHRGAAKIRGLELNSRMSALSRRSIELNSEEKRYSVIEGDYRNIRTILPSESASLVISNPPYRSPASGYISPKPGIAMAKHELTANYRDVICAAAYLLPTGGRLAMSHLPEKLPEIICCMQSYGIIPKRLRFVHSHEGRPAGIVLIESRRGAQNGLKVEPPLYLYDNAGNYSPEVQAYYK